MANVSNIKVKRGNKLQLSGSTVEITGSTSINGNLSGSTITASYFVGDGSNLTGLNLSGSAVVSLTASNGLLVNASQGNVTVSLDVGAGLTTGSGQLEIDTGVVVTLTGSQTISGVKTFQNGFTASSAYFSGDIIVNGTASITQLNTLNETSLIVGDKYITILSGGVDHTGIDGAGILWGASGSSGETTGALGEHAHAFYNASFDAIELFPGLYVTGSTTVFDISGTVARFTSVTGSFSGDGSGLTGLNLSGSAVTSFAAGNGLATTASTGSITVSVVTGSGITIVSGAVAVDSTVVRTSGDQTIGGVKTFTSPLTSSGASFSAEISGTTAQFTTLTASNVTVSGSMLIYGTASLAANPSAAYVRYESSNDVIVIFPGLTVSGNIATTGSVSASVFTGSGAGLTNIPASSLSGTVAVAKGGTGLSTTPTNGQLLIGNGTGYSLNSLSAGTGIGITNGAGTITVAFTGSTGTVTSILPGTNIGIDDTDGPTVTVSLSSSLVGLTSIASTAITGTNVLIDGSLKVSGSLARSIVTINSSYSVIGTDQVIFADITSSADLVVTLPSPQQVNGREIIVKRADNGTQTGVVVVSASVNIDDSNEYELAGGFQAITLIANSGSNKWFVV